MRITANTLALYQCLETVEKALPLRSTMVSICNILFEIKEEELVFSATNLEMAVRISMEHRSNATDCLLLPPKIIEIMRYFPTDEVNIDIDTDNYRLQITGGDAQFHLSGSDPREYPAALFGERSNGDQFRIDSAKFKKILRSVIFATSSEETRPAFNGVLFSFQSNLLALTASDTYRLVIKEEENENWAFEEKKCLVPARSLRELLRIAGNGSSEIAIGITGNIISFTFDRIFFASRLLEEKYPDVGAVIPTVYKTRIRIDRKMFEETINRAALLAEGKNQAVHLILKNSKLEARVSSQEGSMEEILPVEQDGDDIELYVNTRFVLDILRIMDDREIVIDFHGEGGPLIFRLIDDQRYLYLVLPIKKVN